MVDRNYFINGITELLILSILEVSDSYVYEITRKIKKDSGGLLDISQNTIYTAAYKLCNEGKLTERTELVGKRRTRIYYHITEEGQLYLEELMQYYSQTTKGVHSVLSFLNFTKRKGDVIHAQIG